MMSLLLLMQVIVLSFSQQTQQVSAQSDTDTASFYLFFCSKNAFGN